ncbi:winged helix-turn-helix domain-containing protein [Streptomyces sp. NPDC006446]|uniref:winged helix-turn-helix domain-containing protein n=1 Tax=Streptomyces sp. NPDC006446 TaxID=3154301 RepID=UPI0033AC9743
MIRESVAVNGITRRTHIEIADILRDRIRTGQLKVGDRLSTQADLAQEFGVERGAVRQALRILHNDGLLVNVTKGSPPRIAEPRPSGREPQSTMVTLAPMLAEAFSVPHVSVDVICLTSETLMVALSAPLQRIHAGEIRPESISLRVLLPSRKIQLAFPAPLEGWGQDHDQDNQVRQHWLALRNSQVTVVKHNLLALRDAYGISVDVTFRVVPFTPPMKLYVLNGTEALVGYYLVAEHEEPKDGGALELHDVRGVDSILLPFDSRSSQRDAAFVEQSAKWFDSLWETISRELSLA